MAATSDPAQHERDDNGRPVTNKDLKILALGIDNKLDVVLAKIVNLEEWRTTYGTKVDANTEEIRALRERNHLLVNKLTAVQLQVSPLTLEFNRELVQMLPLLRRGADMLSRTDAHDALEQEEITWIRREREMSTKRSQAWSGIDRELFVVLLVAVLSPILLEIIRHFVFGQPF